MNLAALAEQNLAEYGEYERLIFEGKSYSNRDLHEASLRFARALVELGCTPGDKVVLMMPNGPEVLSAYPAIWRAGLVVVPVLFVLEARELAHIVRNSAAKVIVTSPDVLPKVREALAALPEGADVRVVVTGEGAPPAGCDSYDALVGSSPPLTAMVPRDDADIATILSNSQALSGVG